MHQWWGDNVSEDAYERTFFKEGYADLSEGYNTARTAATAAGGLGTPAGDAAFEASLRNRFNTTYNSTSAPTGTSRRRTRSNATCSAAQHLHAPGRAYIALRAILGKANFDTAQRRRSRPPTAAARSPSRSRSRSTRSGCRTRAPVLGQARRVLQAVVGHGLRRLAGGRQQAADHGPRPGRARLLRRHRRLHRRPVGGTVPATLA